MNIEVVVRAKAEVGEGPVWRADTGTLLWVDIPAGELHEVSLATGTTATRTIGQSLGAAALSRTGDLVIACEAGFGRLAADDFTVTDGFLPAGQRMNDAKCDPAGRYWAGSTTTDFQPGHGAVHALAPDGTRTTPIEGLTLPNGLDWSPDGRTFYLADTFRHEIMAWDVDPADGTLQGRRVLTSMPDAMPDGMTIDTDGCLWVAIWGGARLERIAPDGRTIATVPMPVVQPSSCTFGGPGLDTLFVTSASAGLAADPDALDGSVFAVDGLGAQGLPTAVFGIGRQA